MILPFYHPTTVVFVDDSKLFVRSVGLRIASELEVEVIEDARVALERINRIRDVATFFPHCDTKVSTVRRMEFDSSAIANQFDSLTRFRRVSVVVVDYGMPAMSGLQLCSQIEDGAVQKVLITGLADHREVLLRAFAERSIQGFIPKERATLFSQLLKDIRHLKRQYFIEKARYFETQLGMEPTRFAQEPVVVDYFNRLCARLEVAEHYVVQDPPGILMVSDKGAVHRLIVLDETQMHYHPKTPASKSKVTSMDYSSQVKPPEGMALEELAVDFERLDGGRAWYVGLTPQAGGPNSLLAASYSSYIEELDRRY